MKKTGLLFFVFLCVAGLAAAQTEADFDIAPEGSGVVIHLEGSAYTGGTVVTTMPVGSGVVIAKYKGKGGAVVIPATIGGKPVVGIGRQAFLQSAITSVTIPAGLRGRKTTAAGYNLSCGAPYFCKLEIFNIVK
jgi:hypothetical protein